MRILSTAGRDADEWNRLVDRIPEPHRDLHYRPEYMRIYERTYGIRGALFLSETTGGGAVIQPMMLSRVPPDLIARAELDGDWWDARSVYGYGGPLVAGDIDEKTAAGLVAAFRDELDKALGSMHVVTEFGLLHPVLGESQRRPCPAGLNLEYYKDVACIDLTRPAADIWAEISEQQRKAIHSARNRGIEVRKQVPSAENMTDFQHRYLATMNRVGAEAFWHFPETYFPACHQCLGDERASLFEAYRGDTWLASFFLIQDRPTAYYHFAANGHTTESGLASSLLLLDTLLWARASGYAYYHLGGGRTAAEDDSLFRFKLSFGAARLPLFGYKRILDHSAYDALVRSACETSPGDRQNGASSFFPIYRKGRAL